MRRVIAPVLLLALVAHGCRRVRTDDDEVPPLPLPTGQAVLPAPAPPQQPPREPVGDPRTVAEIKEYHDTRSEMAGKATLTQIVALRIDVISDKMKVAHVEYDYLPIDPEAAPAKGGAIGTRSPYRWATTEDGPAKKTDQRTFEYKKESGAFRIKSMGGKKSASFGADLEGWSDAKAISELTTFYDRRGVWAGQFRLGDVARYRVDKIDEQTKLGFIEYLYIPLPGNNRETGFDKRTFRFVKTGSGWSVTSMGDHMSALKGLLR